MDLHWFQCGSGSSFYPQMQIRIQIQGANLMRNHANANPGCGVAMWLVRRAAVRQSRVQIPPGTPPLVQPRKIQEQKSYGADFSQCSSRRDQRSSRRVSPSLRVNIVSIRYCRQKITKINKKSARKGTKKKKESQSWSDYYVTKSCDFKWKIYFNVGDRSCNKIT